MEAKLPVNLVNLKYFCDAVRHESISASAKINHVSQSAVSQGISKLGNYFGFPLLDHLPGRFRATHEGQKLYEAVSEIFNAMEIAEKALSLDKPTAIQMACTYSYASAFLPSLVKECRERFPNIRLNCKFGLPDEILQWVKKGVVHFAVLLDNLDLSRYDLDEVCRGEYRLFCSTKEQLGDSPSFILDSEDRIETNLLKKAYRRVYRKPLPVLMEVASWEVVAALAEEGLGLGLLPDYVAKRRQNTLKIYPQEYFSMPYTLYAVFPSSAEGATWREGMLSILREI